MKTNQWRFDKENARNVRLVKDCSYDFTLHLDVGQLSKDASDFLRSLGKLYDAERATEEARQLHEGIVDLTSTEGIYQSDEEVSSKRRSSDRIKKDKEMKAQLEEVHKFTDEEEGEKRVIRKRVKRVKKSPAATFNDSGEESSIETMKQMILLLSAKIIW